ncbi:MAG: hypothetical protein AVDCRST_MAG71-1334, partial [uncultured Lysobacter sp.]
ELQRHGALQHLARFVGNRVPGVARDTSTEAHARVYSRLHCKGQRTLLHGQASNACVEPTALSV